MNTEEIEELNFKTHMSSLSFILVMSVLMGTITISFFAIGSFSLSGIMASSLIIFSILNHFLMKDNKDDYSSSQRVIISLYTIGSLLIGIIITVMITNHHINVNKVNLEINKQDLITYNSDSFNSSIKVLENNLDSIIETLAKKDTFIIPFNNNTVYYSGSPTTVFYPVLTGNIDSVENSLSVEVQKKFQALSDKLSNDNLYLSITKQYGEGINLTGLEKKLFQRTIGNDTPKWFYSIEVSNLVP